MDLVAMCSLSAVAWKSSRLIRVDAEMLHKALEVHPDMGYAVMRALSAVFSRRFGQVTAALIKEQELVCNGSWRRADVLRTDA